MNWNASLLTYLVSQSLPVIGVSGSSYSDPNFRIDYSEGATDAQKAQANTIASTYVVPPQPNPTAFVAAVTADTTLEPVALLMATQYAAIQSYALNPAFIQLIWSQFVGAYGPSASPPGPLTQAMITAIESYAVAANCPLT